MEPSALKRSPERGDPGMEAKKRRLSTKDLVPRSYQVMIFEEALWRNTVAVLDTDSGKTMAALMMIKEMGKDLGVGVKRKLIVFLAPTAHLVHRQYEVIRLQTELSTMQYYGAMWIDQWPAESRKKEISAHQVMVTTPQILLDALRKAFLDLDMVRLIIFDECHRATGNHPYAIIMKEFYHKHVQKPTIFGMMTSPLTRKGVSSLMDCEDQLSELESILDSKIYTVVDRGQMDPFVHTAKRGNRYYDHMLSLHINLKKRLVSMLVKFDASLAHLEKSPICQFRDAEDIIIKSRKDSWSWHGKICHCLDDLGLICASEAAKICSESVQLPCPAKCCIFSAESVAMCNSFLEEMMQAIEDCFTQDYTKLLSTEHGHLEAINSSYISPKLFELLQLLKSFLPNQVQCLIFVDTIVTAQAVERFLKKVCYTQHLNVSYLMGVNNSGETISPELQKETLHLFRSGEVNLLFTTNVTDENLDLPERSCVIYFDLPRKVCNYVPTCGGARQAGSRYIVMLERGNNQQRDLLFNIIKSKHSMMDTALNRDKIPLLQKSSNSEEIVAFCVELTGATLTADSSIGLINKYCAKLPKEKYYTTYPTFQFSTSNGYWGCTLTLPPNAVFPNLAGPFTESIHKAKQLVCLEACKKLHQLHALDVHLLPITEEPLDIELSKGNDIAASGAGTTKRKEQHGTVTIAALSGVWLHQKVGVTLQGYKLNFLCNKIDQKYASFVLLIDAELDKDVASLNLDLYLHDKMVNAFVSPCGPVQLEAVQVEHAKRFHELLFNGTFGRLFKGSKSSGITREFLLKEDDDSLWKESYMYILLPLESPCIQDQDTLRINWKGITDCASVVEFLKRMHVPEANYSSDVGAEPSQVYGSSVVTDSCRSDMIHLANKIVHAQSLKDKVVISVHTGRLYSVVDVVAGSSAHKPFESSDFATFSEYFTKQYGIVLQHPGQPLLLLKHTHNPHNLLSAKFSYEGNLTSKKSKSATQYVKKPLNNIQMPPELLVQIDVQLEVLKSIYLIPSLMYRMESLMLASQLRREIAFHPTDSCISSNLILEAITTLRCCEAFSLERLELLGDSVLKYALGCHLYLKFSENHEGQLSSQRSQIVCNATLHKLGVDRNLQGYIRDAAFDPRRWVAPGQLTNRPSPCNCGVSEGSLDFLHRTDDTSIVLGKFCDRGHRWICSKTISDCVEALIGAYYVGGGLTAAIAAMKWLGIDVELAPELVDKSITSMHVISKVEEIKILESKIGYVFTNKGLLLEAITHPSQQEVGTRYCYQRLEFLGDATLDLAITWHLFNTYKDIDQGELTDLRSASVNNESFARCAVKHKLQHHIQHASGLLLEQITEYATQRKEATEATEDECMPSVNGSAKGPKVLGDIVESIAGAVLLDTSLDLHKVWEIFEPLLSPIVTPGNLELPPVKELIELLDHNGYCLNMDYMMKGEIAIAQLSVQLEKVYLAREGRDKNKKNARCVAASLLLKDLEKHGIARSRGPSKPNQHEGKSAEKSFIGTDVVVDTVSRVGEIVESTKSCDLNSGGPVVLSVSMEKGGPRIALYQLCQKSQWAMPRFEQIEHKTSAEAAESSSAGNPGLIQFASIITLHIPNATGIRLQGEMRPDKKTAQDSAALVMLYELQQQGRCILKKL